MHHARNGLKQNSTALITVSLVCALLATSRLHAARPPRYNFTELGSLGGPNTCVEDINNAGQVVGFSDLTPTSEFHAFLWEEGEMIDLGCLYPGGSTRAYGVNDLAQVTGSAWSDEAGQYRPFLWEDGSMMDIDPGDPCSLTEGTGVNNAGQVSGGSRCLDGQAFVWSAESGIETLGTLGGPTQYGV